MLLRFSFLDNSQEFRNFTYFLECMVDAYIVVLRNLAGRELVCSYNFTSVHPWSCERIFLACGVFTLLAVDAVLPYFFCIDSFFVLFLPMSILAADE